MQINVKDFQLVQFSQAMFHTLFSTVLGWLGVPEAG